MLHPGFDMGTGVAVDALHTIFLGVTLQLLDLWFGKKNRTQPYSIRNKV